MLGATMFAAPNIASPAMLLSQGSELLFTRSITLKQLDCIHLQAQQLAAYFPDPQRCMVGVLELLLNALEHGNLGIRTHEKDRLLRENRWEEEIARRLAMACNAHKQIHIAIDLHPDAITLSIADDGEGFDWQHYLRHDLPPATTLNGRGIAIAQRMAFDELRYNAKGNRVMASCMLPAD
jgi:hypothetical protein